MTIVGISLGTTNSMITAYREERIIKIPNTFGEYLTPSVVSFDHDGRVYVGKTARERMATCPEVTFSRFKNNLGSNKEYIAYNRTYKAEELTSLIIKQLIDDARNYLGEEIIGAIIAVPAYFNNFQRQGVKLAGEMAGIKVNRLINEPGAAALGYSCYPQEEALYMIFDMGGGTLDVSLVATFEDTIEVLASDGDEHLGGDDFTAAIVDHFCTVNSIDRSSLNAREEEILFRKCEEAKILLGDINHLDLKIWLRKKLFTLRLNKSLLTKLYAGLLGRIQKTVIRAVRDAGVPLEELKDVVLLGGGAKASIVKSFIANLTGMIPISPFNAEELVALGAGTVAGMEEGNHHLKNILIKDNCPFSLGVNIYNEGDPDNDIFSPIIERNSTLPCSKVRCYSTIKDNQKSISFRIYQGENIYCKENLEIGLVRIELPETSKGTRAADVRFTYDISGILEVEIVNVLTNEVTKKYIVSKSNSMTEEEIEKRFLELQEIKIHPRDQIKNKHLIEWAKRLYQENTGENREMISNTLAYFERALKLQDEYIIKNSYDYCYQALSMIDSTSDYFSISDHKSHEHHKEECTSGYLN